MVTAVVGQASPGSICRTRRTASDVAMDLQDQQEVLLRSGLPLNSFTLRIVAALVLLCLAVCPGHDSQ